MTGKNHAEAIHEIGPQERVEVLDVDASGVMLGAPSGAQQVLASSSSAMRVLELYELQADQGPCVDCYSTGVAVVNIDLGAANSRWPRFAPQAVGAGFRSVHALPLRLRGRTIGALNIFRTAEGYLDGSDVMAAQGLADIATIAIIQHQVSVDAQTLNLQLSEALNSRITIEQAKGKISQAANIDTDRAFQRLRTHARNHNLPCPNLLPTSLPASSSPTASTRSHDLTPHTDSSSALAS
jgi:GAF domain-containing protein